MKISNPWDESGENHVQTDCRSLCYLVQRIDMFIHSGGFAACGIIALFWLASSTSAQPSGTMWSLFKQRFVTAEGRVVDNANSGISHSEGQGYGLILAESNNDRETFTRIWKWTAQNLGQRKDHLFAWLWKSEPAGGEVSDKNNATDGDLLIAWGLARAASAWGDSKLRASAREIAQDIRREMVRPSSYGPVLLPGENGFEPGEGLIVNLSYWIFPAFRSLATIDPAPDWQLLEQSGLKLIEAARFSPWELPPDWLFLAKSTTKVAEGFEPVYGYNAVRIPLYMAWAGIEPAEYYASFRRFALFSLPPDSPTIAAKILLPSGKPVGPPSTNSIEVAIPGMIAIYELISGVNDLHPSALEAPYHEVSPDESYYSVSLGLLSNCAAMEAGKNSP
jgi:endo-1,4-beta-D-glucanase Y